MSHANEAYQAGEGSSGLATNGKKPKRRRPDPRKGTASKVETSGRIGQDLAVMSGPDAEVIPVPRQLIEELAALKMPRRTDRRMQALMDLNNDGELTAEGRRELESLVDLSTQLSLFKGQAMYLLKSQQP